MCISTDCIKTDCIYADCIIKDCINAKFKHANCIDTDHVIQICTTPIHMDLDRVTDSHVELNVLGNMTDSHVK